ncbi:DMT family transporter [Acinetobacter soli]|uniref:DMT family transporter n=1 Tax=Acinetobacter soli TaxID=487316 RepID=UPI0032B41E60
MSITSSSKFPEIVLILITILWGGTFLAVHYALNFTSPIFFVGTRFGIAAAVLFLVSYQQLKNFSCQEVIAGFFIGIVIAFSYVFQTVGLQTITSSESAFLTALYVPFVPILLFLFFKKVPAFNIWIGVVLAFFGLLLLTGNSMSQIDLSYGQIMTICSAIGIAMEIILIGFFAGKVNLGKVTFIQLVVASIACFVAIPFSQSEYIPNLSWQFILIVGALGCASALIQFAMNWAQRTVDPSKAAIIYSGEPVWAAIFGRLAGERLSILSIFGGILVLLGVLVSELKFKKLWVCFFKR